MVAKLWLGKSSKRKKMMKGKYTHSFNTQVDQDENVSNDIW